MLAPTYSSPHERRGGVDAVTDARSRVGGRLVAGVDKGSNVAGVCSPHKQASDLPQAFTTSPK